MSQIEGSRPYRLMIYSLVGLFYLVIVALGVAIIAGLLRLAF